MTILKIKVWPNPALRLVAEPVHYFQAVIRPFVDDMLETMYANGGVGLAATQVGVALRVFVMDTSKDRSTPLVFVNPQITEHAESRVQLKGEGCLSFPGIWETVDRYPWVAGSAQNVSGETFSFRYEGLEAQCAQHEYDHLLGKVMIDHMRRPHRRLVEKTLAKYLEKSTLKRKK